MDTTPASSTDLATWPSSLPAPLELTFLTALWEVWQALTARGEAELRARHSLDLRSFIALAYLQSGEGQPARLARELGVPRYEVSRVLHALESRGAVSRISAHTDARRVTVTVTPGGAALYAAALDTVRSVTGPPLATLGLRAEHLTRDLSALAGAARSLPSLSPQQESA
ncbi:MarR family winged helix-turn-helix transcriptional regulator [Deinococcus sp. QL22]|uniref:MarR family winged helix-turn-helix transcriptional regulator n=1 Tax=Deinococcus sp. QL22 TaxID=2939437 RepID=UPI00201822F2|nr:helix-turn-helix domain-containing protein [Deinococcus sp. QL22]UQN08112.1 MarR family transcriptional regulator [Deinococcus sp. QL22]